MNPDEFIRGLIDGTTRLLSAYLVFIVRGAVNPFGFYARQYYRSYIAADREISASGFLAVTALAIVFLSPVLSGTMRHDGGVTKYAITLSSSGALTLPVVAAAIATTLLMDMLGRQVFARVFIHASRSRRFQRIWLLAMASSAVWAWITFWALFWATTLWPPAHACFIAPLAFVSLPLIIALVTAKQLTPLACYMRQCRDRTCRAMPRPRLRSKFIRPALLVPFSVLVLCAAPLVFTKMVFMLFPTTRQLSIIHLACDTVTPPQQPIRGSIIIANDMAGSASFSAAFHLLVNFTGGTGQRYTPLTAVMNAAAGTNMLHLNVNDVAVYRFSARPPSPYGAAAITLRPEDCAAVPPTALRREPADQN